MTDIAETPESAIARLKQPRMTHIPEDDLRKVINAFETIASEASIPRVLRSIAHTNSLALQTYLPKDKIDAIQNPATPA